jgi:hypothetical protein
MRRFSPYAIHNSNIQAMLAELADASINADVYRLAFKGLGEQLGKAIAAQVKGTDSITIVASSEDADWLMRGILDGMNRPHAHIVVLWNNRANTLQGKELPANSPFAKEDFDVAPVIKSFIESDGQSDTMIVCKSIIYTSCVVRTNLLHMMEQVAPRRIVIAAPVMFTGAEAKLRAEFPPEISAKFEFVYFAVDDEEDKLHGIVIPGIGGSVYERLGIGNAKTKNQYIPQIVKERRAGLRTNAVQ